MSLEALLTARPAGRMDLGAWYARVLEIAAREGMRIPELAERLGCARETLYAWRRRLVKEGHTPRRPAAGLVRVQLAQGEAEPRGQCLEVRLRGCRSIFVPSPFDASALAALIAVLERC